MELNIINYIKPELLVLVVVLSIIGTAIKHTTLFKDKYIPLILGLTGVVLAFLWIVADTHLASPQEWMLAIFTGLVQGVLCAGASVYAHQVVKQLNKKE